MKLSEMDWWVLCEDSLHECFVRYFLEEHGVDSRYANRYNANVASKGKGSGAGYVLKRFPEELKKYRSARIKRALAFLVVIDADTAKVQDRIALLKKQCDERGVPFREEGDRVAIVIPRRSIDTWIVWLEGRAADAEIEEFDYSRGAEEPSTCKPQARSLVELCRGDAKALTRIPDSLAVACKEYRRLFAD